MKNAKNIFWLLLDALLVVMFFLGLITFKALDRYGASLPITRTITVSADAKATIVPDIAKISFSVVSVAVTTAMLSNASAEGKPRSISTLPICPTPIFEVVLTLLR